jgi:putative phage-type endonuclease
MKIIDCIQGTPEWHAARSGKVTASSINCVTAKVKTDKSKMREDYKIQIVTERLMGKPAEGGYFSDVMKWGLEQELFARAAYEMRSGALVDQVGFVVHPSIDGAGMSPDGLVGDQGLVEIKCPLSKTHIRYFLDGKVPSEYKPQMLWQMACSERAWCDFVSFDPRLPEDLQLFTVRFERDDAAIKAMEAEVLTFLAEVDDIIKRLRK